MVAESSSLAALVNEMCSSQKLNRDRASEHMTEALQSATSSELASLQCLLIEKLNNTLETWEEHYGLLSTASNLLEKPKEPPTAAFQETVFTFATSSLTHGEWRVRTAAGLALAALCKLNGVGIYEKMQERLFCLLHENFERCPADAESSAGDSNSAERVFHDTAGWGNLETTINCLKGS